ncbi:phosphopantetheine-binding protein, partial [Mycobacteroides abscessus]
DVGGDSISAMRVVAAINTALDVDLEVWTMFDAPSVRGLSARLNGAVSASPIAESSRTSCASVHGRGVTQVLAADLTLDKFVDVTALIANRSRRHPRGDVREILLT